MLEEIVKLIGNSSLTCYEAARVLERLSENIRAIGDRAGDLYSFDEVLSKAKKSKDK